MSRGRLVSGLRTLLACDVSSFRVYTVRGRDIEHGAIEVLEGRNEKGTSFVRFSSEAVHTEDNARPLMPEIQYHQLADHALEDLLERIEEFLEVVDVDDSDIEFSQGVLTIRLGKLGTYVINKQTPNRQIWMSSPISGPVRYDYEKGAWVYHRDGHKMHERLENEMEQLTGVKVDLNPCTTCERLGTCVNGSDCPV